MRDYCTRWRERGIFGSFVDCCCQHDADYDDPCFGRAEADRYLRL